jgi:RNA polymerase sigma factor (sigma-70 family)
METLPDEILVEFARQGRCDALGILMRRHEDAVYNIVHNLCGSSPEAEELIYQTILSAWWENGSPGPNGSFRTWILGKAIQAALAARRHEASPAFDRSDLAGRLREALDRLDDQVRAAFVLCDLAEIPGHEAAMILHASPREIRQRVHRARLMLIGELDGSSRRPVSQWSGL